MSEWPKRFSDRVESNLKRFQKLADQAQKRDVSEADTVTVIKDVFCDLLGYDKYSELTSEHKIRGTMLDLAVKLGGRVKFLVEVKSAGTKLNNSHLRQAVHYGAEHGIEWIILTNSVHWRIFNVKFVKPIDYICVFEFDLTKLANKDDEDIYKLFMISKEGATDDALVDFLEYSEIMNEHVVGQILVSEPVVQIIRRELRRLFPGLNADLDDVTTLLSDKVIRREVFDPDKAKEAKSMVNKARKRLARAQAAEEAS